MRNLPELMQLNNGAAVTDAAGMAARRKELLETLEQYAYGKMPAAVPVTAETVSETGRCCGGDARFLELRIICRFPTGDFAFPLRLFLPNGDGKKPLILLMNFAPDPYSEYCPAEEIVDNGFALAYVYYKDVTADDGDFENGAAKFFPRTGGGNDTGKIGIWAWSLSRALDALTAMEEIDAGRIAVIGHSRLGKTALWCAANDPRVRYVCSNDSGCMGAALNRGRNPGGETIADITRNFPFWFCDRLRAYKDDVDALPFDQHFLLACVAPRYVLVNSASLDDWADPPAEQRACAAASPAWAAYGKTGFAGDPTPCGVNEGSLTGDIGYFKRYGVHFLGRKDWLRFMEFIQKREFNAPR